MQSARLLPIILILASFTACRDDKAPSVGTATPAQAASGETAPAKPVSQDYVASGPLVVENQVDVSALREGVIAQVLVDVGAPVRKGQLLGRLDDRQLTANRDAVKAKADGMEADYQHWQADLKLRQSDFERAQEMWNAQLITAKQLDHERYSVESGKFFLQRQVEDLKNAAAELKSAELELEKAKIVAPFDGVVARRYVRVGQKVAQNDRLFWVTATSPLNVRFTLPQEFAGKIKIGEEVQVAAPLEASQPHAAKITQVSPVVDPASGTLELQAQVVGGPGELRPGMTVNIKVKPR